MGHGFSCHLSASLAQRDTGTESSGRQAGGRGEVVHSLCVSEESLVVWSLRGGTWAEEDVGCPITEALGLLSGDGLGTVTLRRARHHPSF